MRPIRPLRSYLRHARSIVALAVLVVTACRQDAASYTAVYVAVGVDRYIQDHAASYHLETGHDELVLSAADVGASSFFVTVEPGAASGRTSGTLTVTALDAKGEPLVRRQASLSLLDGKQRRVEVLLTRFCAENYHGCEGRGLSCDGCECTTVELDAASLHIVDVDAPLAGVVAPGTCDNGANEAPEAASGAIKQAECSSLCSRIGMGCPGDESAEGDCTTECAEDLIAGAGASCSQAARALERCCAETDYATVCRDGSDLDIKRCFTACPIQTQLLDECLGSTAPKTCQWVCSRVVEICGEYRHELCFDECTADQHNATSAGNGDAYQEFLDCCAATPSRDFWAACSENHFDPCSTVCAYRRPISAGDGGE